jgi:hypothetical protein
MTDTIVQIIRKTIKDIITISKTSGTTQIKISMIQTSSTTKIPTSSMTTMTKIIKITQLIQIQSQWPLLRKRDIISRIPFKETREKTWARNNKDLTQQLQDKKKEQKKILHRCKIKYLKCLCNIERL